MSYRQAMAERRLTVAVRATSLVWMLLLMTSMPCAARKEVLIPDLVPSGSENVARNPGSDLMSSAKRSLQQQMNKTSEELDALNVAMLDAAEEGELEDVKAAVMDGADINVQHLFFNEAPPVAVAARNGHLSIVQYLIGLGANVNLQSAAGTTALRAASFDCLNPGVLDALIDAGADMDIQDVEGVTALIIAAEEGQLECVNILINAGANLDIRDEDGFTALMRSADRCHPIIAQALQDGGEERRFRDRDPSREIDAIRAIDCDTDEETDEFVRILRG